MSELESLALNSPLRASSWLVLGDLNQTLILSDHSNQFNHQTFSGVQRELAECLQVCGLSDIPFQGQNFTWSNHQDNNPIAEKLDRMLGNYYWFEKFSSVIATFEDSSFQTMLHVASGSLRSIPAP